MNKTLKALSTLLCSALLSTALCSTALANRTASTCAGQWITPLSSCTNTTSSNCTAARGDFVSSTCTISTDISSTITSTTCSTKGGTWVPAVCIGITSTTCSTKGGTWIDNRCTNTTYSACTSAGGAHAYATCTIKDKTYAGCKTEKGAWAPSICKTTPEKCTTAGGTWTGSPSYCIMQKESTPYNITSTGFGNNTASTSGTVDITTQYETEEFAIVNIIGGQISTSCAYANRWSTTTASNSAIVGKCCATNAKVQCNGTLCTCVSN